MTALWWAGLTLALLGVLTPHNREPMARRLATLGIALLALNLLQGLVTP